MRTRQRTGLLTLLAAIAITGCSDGGGSAAPPAQAPRLAADQVEIGGTIADDAAATEILVDGRPVEMVDDRTWRAVVPLRDGAAVVLVEERVLGEVIARDEVTLRRE